MSRNRDLLAIVNILAGLAGATSGEDHKSPGQSPRALLAPPDRDYPVNPGGQ